MRHHNSNRKFGRKRRQRASLKRSLAISLIGKGKITTTEAKAKEIRPYVEKLITKAKNPKNVLATRRILVSRVGDVTSKKLIETLGPKYKTVSGGYSRITKLVNRVSDGAKMATIELI